MEERNQEMPFAVRFVREASSDALLVSNLDDLSATAGAAAFSEAEECRSQSH